MRPRWRHGVVRLTALALLATTTGCSGCGHDDRDDSEHAASTEQRAAGGETHTGQDDSEAAPEPGPPPVVRIAAQRPDIDPGFVPVVQSRGDEPAKLAREVTVQREDGGEWTDVATVSLRWSCEQPAEQGCVTLVPGAELRPPPWLGNKGDGAQCDGGGEAAPKGTYRFVAQSCDGAHTLAGEPFDK